MTNTIRFEHEEELVLIYINEKLVATMLTKNLRRVTYWIYAKGMRGSFNTNLLEVFDNETEERD